MTVQHSVLKHHKETARAERKLLKAEKRAIRRELAEEAPQHDNPARSPSAYGMRQPVAG
jgi:hypothetical protein